MLLACAATSAEGRAAVTDDTQKKKQGGNGSELRHASPEDARSSEQGDGHLPDASEEARPTHARDGGPQHLLSRHLLAMAGSGAALTSDQLEEIREAFKLFDTDDSGTIDSDGA